MSIDGRLQMALAHDATFLDRVQFAMAKIALQVIGEDPATVVPIGSHAARRAYAAAVLGDPARAAASFAVGLVSAVNLTARTTTITVDGVTTTANDDEIASQVATLWSAYSGV